MTGSWMDRGNQYIQFVRVLYCKLPANGKQLPAFPLEAVRGYHCAAVAPTLIVQGSHTVIKYIVSTDIGLMSKLINIYIEEE